MTAQAGDTPNCERTRLRQQARAARRGLSPAQRRRHADAAAAHALRLLRRSRARSVAAYVHHASELSTAPLLRMLLRADAAIHLPVVARDGDMRFLRWHGGPLRQGAYGIPRPVAGAATFRNALDVVFLPLLGFDAHGTRLGAGGGYYDRWLADRRGRRPLLCGYAFGVQEFARLPRAEWDVPLDAVVTERGYRRFPSLQRQGQAPWPTG